MGLAKQKKDLTQGPLLSQIVLFSIPLMATAILQLLFNTADTIVVGNWGGDTPEECERALAAVGSCSSLITLFVNLFLGLSLGVGVCVAHDIGAKDDEGVRKTVHTAVLTALGAGVFITVLGLLTTRSLLVLMGTDETVLPEASKYITAYFCGMPANMLYNYCASILRSKGDTVRPLLFLSVAGVANVLFNLFAVLFLRWGAMGVGAATAVSQWISCILIVVYMLRMEGPCKISLSRLAIDLKKLKRMLVIGLPAGLQSTLFAISNVLITSSINSFGPAVMAANTAAGNIDSYVSTSQEALHHAVTTFVAQNMGARKYDRMKKSVIYCVAVVVTIGLTVGSAVYLLRDLLLGIYAPGNPDVLLYGGTRLLIFCFSYFLWGIMGIGSGTLRSLGKSFTAMVVTLVGACLLRIVWIVAVFQQLPKESTLENTLFRLGMLYASYPITWLITSAVLFAMCVFYFKKYKRENLIETKPLSTAERS